MRLLLSREPVPPPWPLRRHEHGIMLLEAVVYVALLAVVLGLAFSAFYAGFENNRNLTRNADDIVRALKAGERWREDVRRASGPPEFVTNAASPLPVLRLPLGTNGVTYSYRDETVYRQAAGDPEPLAVLAGIRSSAFLRDPRQHVTAWRWEVELKGRQKVAGIKPLFTFQSVEPARLAKP